MTTTLEMMPTAETETRPEVLAAEVVTIANRLENEFDPLCIGFREKVGVQVTPLLEVHTVPISGHKLLLKNETVHPCNAYKLRGMTSGTLVALEQNPNLTGVCTGSAGNAALGLAEAANKLDLDCTAHVKSASSTVKQEDLRERGVNVVNHHESLPVALAGAERQAAKDNRTAFIHPFNQTEVMAGQATIMQEALRQLTEQGYDLQNDVVDIVVTGGGLGLAAGSAAWLAFQKKLGNIGPGVRVTVAEIVRYTENGKLDKSQLPWCDGTATTDGDKTRAILDLYADQVGFIEVNETEVAQAMHELTAVLHKRIEPAGALATAAIKKLAAQHPKSWLDEKGEVQYESQRTYVSVVSGANVSDETYAVAEDLRRQAYEMTMQSLAMLVTDEAFTATADDPVDRRTRVASGI